MTDTKLYQSDLAQIHIDGYGFHWQGAARTLMKWLRGHGIRQGVVVDLGCGGGEWMEYLADAGYQVCGIDISPAMIRAAGRRLPQAQLVCGSFVDVNIPACDAVTSLGEPINYLKEKKSIRKVLGNVYRALRPGGVFMFDAREPATKPVPPRTVARVGDDWACIAEIREDHRADTIVRDITTFRKAGRFYRKSREIHRLKVVPKEDMLAWLRHLGFRVRSFRGYGKYRFAGRQSAYLARKPSTQRS